MPGRSSRGGRQHGGADHHRPPSERQRHLPLPRPPLPGRCGLWPDFKGNVFCADLRVMFYVRILFKVSADYFVQLSILTSRELHKSNKLVSVFLIHLLAMNDRIMPFVRHNVFFFLLENWHAYGETQVG